MATRRTKYYKPQSATWWIGLAMLACGVLLFIDSMWSLGFIGDILRGAFGATTPFMLIVYGGGTITMRGALPDVRGM